MQFPANADGKVTHGDLSMWDPAAYMREQNGLSGSWIWPGPNMAVEAI